MFSEYRVDMTGFAHAWGGPLGRALFKSRPADFVVEETLGFSPAGTGSHAWLFVEKQGCNTEWVARQLARFARVKPVDVGYAGLKDRHGLTRQWFSVNLQGREEPAWTQWEATLGGEVRVIESTRHTKKLKRGVNTGNRFDITLRDLDADAEQLESRLRLIQEQGFPNYFDAQRFGRDGMNVVRFMHWSRGDIKPAKHESGMLISAARSFLFNHVLADRIRAQTWNRVGEGEILMLDGSHSVFVADGSDPGLTQRLQAGDVHPTGMMFGADGFPLSDIEQAVLARFPELVSALYPHGLRHERRSLRILPRELTFRREDNNLNLRFILPAGSYATALIRELVIV